MRRTIVACLWSVVLLTTADAGMAADITLSVPKELPANRHFEVAWSGTVEKGDVITIGSESGKPVPYASRIYPAPAKPSGTLRVPEKTGAFTVVYVRGDEVLASAPFTATALSATLKAPAEVPANSEFSVEWTGPANDGDRITMGTEAGSPIPYASMAYAKTSAPKITLKTPAAPGKYTVVYTSGRIVVESIPLTVTGLAVTLEVPATAPANSLFTVKWSGPRNAQDTITIGDADGKPIPYSSSAYTSGPQGTVELKTPEKAGQYSVVYVTGGTAVTHAPISVTGLEATITAPSQVPAESDFAVKWTGPDNTGDHLTVFEADGSVRHFAGHGYTKGSGGEVTLTAPAEPGKYSVAYVTGQTVVHFVPLEVSELQATLKAADSVVANDRFPVRWSGPGHPRDTIIMMGDDPHFALARGYIANSDEDKVMLLAPPKEGAFELRYSTAGGRVLARRPIVVQAAPQPPGTLRVEALSKIEQLPAVEVILDASGSMLQRQGKKRRIEIAKETLTSLLSDTIPAGTQFAMRIFGHKEADSCRTDLEIPLSPLDTAAAIAKVASIEAKNLAKTPIAESLRLTTSDLEGAGRERILILVTDGEETCDGDPAAVIAKLRQQGHDVRVNIVGYAIDDKKLGASFADWADLGGGSYFDAGDETELAAALQRSVQPRFVVRDAKGGDVATGTAGEGAITLAAGTYDVVFGPAGQEKKVPVAIRPGAETTAQLVP